MASVTLELDVPQIRLLYILADVGADYFAKWEATNPGCGMSEACVEMRALLAPKVAEAGEMDP